MSVRRLILAALAALAVSVDLAGDAGAQTPKTAEQIVGAWMWRIDVLPGEADPDDALIAAADAVRPVLRRFAVDGPPEDVNAAARVLYKRQYAVLINAGAGDPGLTETEFIDLNMRIFIEGVRLKAMVGLTKVGVQEDRDLLDRFTPELLPEILARIQPALNAMDARLEGGR